MYAVGHGGGREQAVERPNPDRGCCQMWTGHNGRARILLVRAQRSFLSPYFTSVGAEGLHLIYFILDIYNIHLGGLLGSNT